MFIETGEVGFDNDGYAVHKVCGERLTEEWSITRTESYFLKRDGSAEYESDGGSNRDCDGVWCCYCDEQIVMRKEEK